MAEQKKVGYLCGGARVSTKDGAEASGPRTHVLGVISAFKRMGWDVEEFIVGDMVSSSFSTTGSEKVLTKSIFHVIAGDIARVCVNIFGQRIAWWRIGRKVSFVYERFASYQALGNMFRRRGIPWILETNGIYYHEAKNDRGSIFFERVAKFLELNAYRKCTYLICPTAELKEIIIKEGNVPPEKILVVPNGVDTGYYDPAQWEPNRHFSEFTVGFVGTMTAWQNLSRLLQAVKNLNQKNIPISITLVGNGLEFDNLKEQVAELGIENKVKLAGRVKRSEIPSLILGFDCAYACQVPPEYGKFYLSPLKLYEYMSMGKPVIATEAPDAKSVIKDEVHGILLDPTNQDALETALAKMHAQFQNAGEVNANTIRKTIEENHSWLVRVEDMMGKIDI